MTVTRLSLSEARFQHTLTPAMRSDPVSNRLLAFGNGLEKKKAAPRAALSGCPPLLKERKRAPVGRRRPILPRADPAVLSAMEGLTSGFGMGPGVPPPPWPPTNRGPCAGTLAAGIARKTSSSSSRSSRNSLEKVVMRRARPISTARLNPSRGLQLRPI